MCDRENSHIDMKVRWGFILLKVNLIFIFKEINKMWNHDLQHLQVSLTSSALSLTVELLLLPHLPFNTSCTVPLTSNLSQILVIVTLVGVGVPNSTLKRKWTSTTFPTFQYTSVTTYVYRMIISPPCLLKHMKNDERVAMIFQCLLDHLYK